MKSVQSGRFRGCTVISLPSSTNIWSVGGSRKLIGVTTRILFVFSHPFERKYYLIVTLIVVIRKSLTVTPPNLLQTSFILLIEYSFAKYPYLSPFASILG